jgi:hypothetical protein
MNKASKHCYKILFSFQCKDRNTLSLAIILKSLCLWVQVIFVSNGLLILVTALTPGIYILSLQALQFCTSQARTVKTLRCTLAYSYLHTFLNPFWKHKSTTSHGFANFNCLGLAMCIHFRQSKLSVIRIHGFVCVCVHTWEQIDGFSQSVHLL